MNVASHIAAGLLIGAMAGTAVAADALFVSSPTPGKLSTLQSVRTEQGMQELMAVGNTPVTAAVTVGQQRIELKGNASFSLRSDEAALKSGVLGVQAFNIVFHDVPQTLLTYGGSGDSKTGNLSFVVAGRQRLQYDAAKGVASGELRGFIGADYMSLYAEPLTDSERDHNRAPRQSAVIKLALQFGEPLAAVAGNQEPVRQKAGVEARIVADADRAIAALPLTIDVARVVSPVEAIIAWPWRWEVARNLCVQPVRVGRFIWNWPTLAIQYTGTGLNFGLPGARTQWKKADVTFTVRDWKTVWRSDLFNFSTGEAADLLDEVNDADCVEVYFVNGDNGMHNNWGGGATFSSGSANTKIISSDGNVPPNIDLTHLAHELGHALDLPHPTATSSSSTNTLMCPSGFMNDNPKRNSQENKDNLSNPLLTFSIKLVSAGPDCTNSASCGLCP